MSTFEQRLGDLGIGSGNTSTVGGGLGGNTLRFSGEVSPTTSFFVNRFDANGTIKPITVSDVEKHLGISSELWDTIDYQEIIDAAIVLGRR